MSEINDNVNRLNDQDDRINGQKYESEFDLDDDPDDDITD